MSENKPRKYFGTDGIRGRANNGKLNALFVTQLGHAVGLVFSRNNKEHERPRVLIGKDTRLSCYTLEPALTGGFTGVGMDVLLTGPLPTPAVAILTASMRADVGVMISASHNPHEDNGIKLFGPDGHKLSDDQEMEIEALIDTDLAKFLVEPRSMGRAQRVDDVLGRYIEIAKASLPRKMNFSGMRVVIDCANGAGYKAGPEMLRELDVEVITIGVTPDGFNINDNCGSTSPMALQKKVRETRADLGIALDGDADRVMLVDERGHCVDGDQLLALIGGSWKQDNRLSKPVVVGTVMSNLGLERYFESIGITLERTDVGDRYILERMREKGYNVGGEQSGHVILSDHTKTGDGIVAALQAMNVMRTRGGKASEVCHLFEPVPQVLENVRYQPKGPNPLENDQVKQCIEAAETELKANGSRLLVRKSGTEPVIRIMAEGDNREVLREVVGRLVKVIPRE